MACRSLRKSKPRSVGQALLSHGLSVERPLAILSGNDIEHLQLALGAAEVGLQRADDLVVQHFLHAVIANSCSIQ